MPAATDPYGTARIKALIVVAHPDDEYALASTTYRITRELFGVVDQVVITSGEGGHRYASLAEAIYGIAITGESGSREALTAIRKREALQAGRILGIREHYFLEQVDPGFEERCADAGCDWDEGRVRSFVTNMVARERYNLVFTLLPRPGVHRHHREAARLLLEAIAALPEGQRPAVIGAEPGRSGEEPQPFGGIAGHPLTRTVSSAPAFVFDRNSRFGYAGALNYQIVANWVIAEYKSQGLFQTDCGKHDLEQFWLFALGGAAGDALDFARRLGEPYAAAVPYQDASYSPSL
jgi:LmbE family N-acetylglucosaminyl deacetylase